MIPDIYVGYMVPGVVRPVPYRVTHFAKPEHIPKPRAGEFFDAYVLPLARECGLLDALGDDCATGGGVGAPGFAFDASGFADADSDCAPVGPTGSAAAGDSALERSWRAPASLAAEVAHVSPAHTPTFEWDFDVAETAACQRDAFATSRSALSRDELRRSLFDMVLGTWVHLLADCTWNQAVSDLLDARGEQPSRDFRIKKQGDFDLFGKSLELDLMPRLTPQLIEVAAAGKSLELDLMPRLTPQLIEVAAAFPQYEIDAASVSATCAIAHETPQLIEVAAAFPQYEIDAASVSATCAIAHETVRTNHPVTGAAYRLLDEEFFSRVFAEVNARAEREMEYAGSR